MSDPDPTLPEDQAADVGPYAESGTEPVPAPPQLEPLADVRCKLSEALEATDAQGTVRNLTVLKMRPCTGARARRIPFTPDSAATIGSMFMAVPALVDEIADASKLRDLPGRDLNAILSALTRVLTPIAMAGPVDEVFVKVAREGGSATMQLVRPVRMGGTTYDRLTFQELRGSHVWDLPLEDLSTPQLLTLVGRLTGENDALIDRLGPEDVGTACAVVKTFVAVFLRGVQSDDGADPATPGS